MRASLLCLVLLLVGACAHKDRNVALSVADLRDGYGYRGHAIAGQKMTDTLFILTLSGGGTRAAALAQGVLRELQATPIGGGRTMLDEVDIISSVSGGSVTAGNLVANGPESFDAFETSFVRQDFMPQLIDALINPVNLVRYALTSESRIDRLVDIFDETVFRGATFGAIEGKRDRPFLMINAADMTTTLRFTFTQSRFDLLCSDLSKFRIAEAVAASSAFPVGLTPVTLTNYSPCDPANKIFERVTKRVDDKLHSDPTTNDGVKRSPDDMLHVPRVDSDPGTATEERYWGLRQSRLLKQDQAQPPQNYMHLLDGGVADNLGLHAVLTDLWAIEEDGSQIAAVSDGTLKHVVFLVVNARADQDPERDLSPTTPGIIDMLWTAISTSIDNRSESLIDNIRAVMDFQFRDAPQKPKTDAIIVDFDLIRDTKCRIAFAQTQTNWGLRRHEIDALLEMGSAIVRASPAFAALTARAGGAVTGGQKPDGSTTWPGQVRAEAACARMLSDDEDNPFALRYGNTE